MSPHLSNTLSIGLTLLCSLMIRMPMAQVGDIASRHEPPIASMLPEGEVTADILRSPTAGTPPRDTETIPCGTVDFSIASDGKVFRFWTDGSLSLLDSITIDAGKSWVRLGDHQLEYTGRAVSNDDDGLPNNWRGYRWSAEITERSNDSPLNSGAPTRRYTVTLGLLRITGQTFLRIQKTYLDSVGSDIDLSLLF